MAPKLPFAALAAGAARVRVHTALRGPRNTAAERGRRRACEGASCAGRWQDATRFPSAKRTEAKAVAHAEGGAGGMPATSVP